MSKKSGVDKFLLDKYFNNQCTADERQVVLDWLSNPENKLLAHEVMQSQWDQIENKPDGSFHMEEVLAKTREKSFGGLSDKAKSQISDARKAKSKHVFSKMAAVSSGIIILILSGLFLTLNQNHNPLANERHTQVKTSSGEIILKVLSDGTKIWLNAESSISFPSSFDGDSIREVLLNGEAFFDVAEDKEHPFIVRTKDINIRVMGTAFNVKSYEGDSTVKTTLVRGRVVVENKNGTVQDNIELRPNQQAVFSHLTEQITLLDVHVEKHTSWNSGSLVFEDDSLLDVIRSLERWYGVVIRVQDKSNMECRLTARIDKESLAETLEILRSLTGIRYSVKGKDVFIQGKICE